MLVSSHWSHVSITALDLGSGLCISCWLNMQGVFMKKNSAERKHSGAVVALVWFKQRGFEEIEILDLPLSLRKLCMRSSYWVHMPRVLPYRVVPGIPLSWQYMVYTIQYLETLLIYYWKVATSSEPNTSDCGRATPVLATVMGPRND